MPRSLLIYFFLLVFFIQNALGFDLRGKVDVAKDWQPVIYLASLDSPEDIFVASPDFILSKTIIDSDGSFQFDPIPLPSDQRFYRLYMVKNAFSAVEFNNPENRNYVHLLLNDQSVAVIHLSFHDNRLTIDQLTGDSNSLLISEFDRQMLVLREKMTADLSKAQTDFLNMQRDDFIKTFVDTCSHVMAGIYALYHIEEKETDFLRNSQFYFDFQKKIHRVFPNALYTRKYDELLESLVGFRELVCEIPGVVPKWKDYVILVESIGLLLLLLLLWMMRKKIKTEKGYLEEKNSFSRLSEKEKVILQLMAEGKSNKEIGGLLYIELSTVKSHINSIYKQLNVSGRKNAIELYHNIKTP